MSFPVLERSKLANRLAQEAGAEVVGFTSHGNAGERSGSWIAFDTDEKLVAFARAFSKADKESA